MLTTTVWSMAKQIYSALGTVAAHNGNVPSSYKLQSDCKWKTFVINAQLLCGIVSNEVIKESISVPPAQLITNNLSYVWDKFLAEVTRYQDECGGQWGQDGWWWSGQ